MRKKLATPQIIKDIRELASNPENVRVTNKAEYDLMADYLTKPGVCEIICNWIDGGGEVEEKITSEPRKHAGKPVYIMKPKLDRTTYYIRVTISKVKEGIGNLLIISAHPSH